MSNPIHIVMTPTRNEAWVIQAFLECNSLWADYIIIADQMSTDKTRERVIKFAKSSAKTKQAEIILIDNPNAEFNEAERQAMLIDKAREIADGRDCMLWGLDADEILPANWQNTEDGKRILNSNKGDVFWFQWAQLSPDKKHYGDSDYFPWLFHDDGVEKHQNYVRNMHSMRIPYPLDEKQMVYVKDFRVLHCGFLDAERVAAKNRFYQFVDWELNHRNPIALSRTYVAHRKENQNFDTLYELKEEAIAFPFDFWSLIEIGATHTWYDDYVYQRINRYTMKQLRKLDIWDEEVLQEYQIEDKRRLIDKFIHTYLHATQRRNARLWVRGIDYLLKRIY